MSPESENDFSELFHTKAMEAGIEMVPDSLPTPKVTHGTYNGPNFLFEYFIDHRRDNAEMIIRVTRKGQFSGREYKFIWNGAWLSSLDNSRRSNEELCSMIISMI